MSRRWLPVVLLASACSPAPDAGTPSDSSAAGGPAPAPADSLVLQGPGVEVWFTDARQATSPDGVPCLERALEVRAGGTSRGVPLLYTREAPT
ncbi:MAG TPA: hypothetical protein VF862_04200, partial [Gemmatimonadales bacterium]